MTTDADKLAFTLQNPMLLDGDVRIEIFAGSQKKCKAALSFHTLFAQHSYHFSVVDKIYKLSDKLPPDAHIELNYTQVGHTTV